MTIQNAFLFLIQIRSDADTTRQFSPPSTDIDLTTDVLIEQGKAAGLSFTPDELRTAFKHDWAMRWQRYHSTTNNDSEGLTDEERTEIIRPNGYITISR